MQLDMESLHNTVYPVTTPPAGPTFHLHPLNNWRLVTGGLHLLRGIPLHRCHFAPHRRHRHGRRPFLPIREQPLFWLCWFLHFVPWLTDFEF